jgi:hypothetical protein
VLKIFFIKVCIYNFSINVFIKEKSKLCFGDRVAILNDFFYQTGGSTKEKILLASERMIRW